MRRAPTSSELSSGMTGPDPGRSADTNCGLCLPWRGAPDAAARDRAALRPDPTRPGLPEGLSWRLSTRGVEPLLSFVLPSQAEIDAVHGRTGAAEFALIVEPNVLMLCCRLGAGLSRQCQPWHACRQEAGYPSGLPGTEAPPEPASAAARRPGRRGHRDPACTRRGVLPPPFVAAMLRRQDRDAHRETGTATRSVLRSPCCSFDFRRRFQRLMGLSETLPGAFSFCRVGSARAINAAA